jgi:hypothetical protein
MVFQLPAQGGKNTADWSAASQPDRRSVPQLAWVLPDCGQALLDGTLQVGADNSRRSAGTSVDGFGAGCSDGYCWPMRPAWAARSSLVRASAPCATWVSTCARVQPGSADASCRSSSVSACAVRTRRAALSAITAHSGVSAPSHPRKGIAGAAGMLMVRRRVARSRGDRPRWLVQLEPIRTALPRAANAVWVNSPSGESCPRASAAGARTPRRWRGVGVVPGRWCPAGRFQEIAGAACPGTRAGAAPWPRAGRPAAVTGLAAVPGENRPGPNVLSGWAGRQEFRGPRPGRSRDAGTCGPAAPDRTDGR